MEIHVQLPIPSVSDFSMNSGKGSDNDVFPERQVGYNSSGFVDISPKGLSIDDTESSFNISDVRDRSGRTKRSAQTEFFMEPGRCV